VLLADPCGVVAEVVGFDIPDTVQAVLQEESLTPDPPHHFRG